MGEERMSSTSIVVKAGTKQGRRVRLQPNSNVNLHQRKKVKHSESKVSTMPVHVQDLGRVDHYFHQNAPSESEPPHGSEFLKQLFRHPHSSCIAVQGGGTEGYVVNRAFIAEAQLKQEKLLQMVESLKRENEKLKSNNSA